MKILWLATLFCTSLASAYTVTLFDRPTSELPAFAYSETSFGVDMNSGEGYVLLENLGTGVPDVCGGSGVLGPCRISSAGLRVVSREKIYIPRLRLDGDTLTMDSSEGPVDCAQLKKTRFFHRTVVRSTGRCALETEISIRDDVERLIVRMTF